MSAGTRVFGWGCAALGVAMALRAARISPWLAILPAILAGAGAVLATLRRRITLDRDDGLLRVEQSILGLASRTIVPLFHLRAVVVQAYGPQQGLRRASPAFARYVAYLERRVGAPIYLDEARACARLLELAEVLAEVGELRLEYDATRRAAARRR